MEFLKPIMNMWMQDEIKIYIGKILLWQKHFF